jgi:mono/diheme cytochrome c family protein
MPYAMTKHDSFQLLHRFSRTTVLSAGLALIAPGCEDAKPETGRSADSADARGGAADGESTAALWCKAKAVFEARCVTCHDGQRTAGAPMALKSFADLSAESAQYPGTKIYTRALARMRASTSPMPPAGDATPAEIRAVEAWIQAGVRAGSDVTCDASDESAANGAGDDPPKPTWPADCENVYTIRAHDVSDESAPYRMAPNTENHPGFTFDAPWGDDEVQALAFRPVTDNKKILHHWILYQAGGARVFLSGWAPGQDDAERSPLPPDVGMYLPRGAKSLYLDMHYYNLGDDTVEELDASGVEVCTVGKANFRPNMATIFMGFMGFGAPMVPANSVNHEVTANCNVSATEPVHLLSVSPHAHRFAKHMKFTATVSGEEIVLHDLPFNFEEQRARRLPQALVLNTGDRVTTTCTYANDTSRDINFGENTDAEMCFNFALYYPMGALSCGGGLGGSGR